MRSVINIRTGGGPHLVPLQPVVLLAVYGARAIAERIRSRGAELLKVGFEIIDWRFSKVFQAPHAGCAIMWFVCRQLSWRPIMAVAFQSVAGQVLFVKGWRIAKLMNLRVITAGQEIHNPQGKQMSGARGQRSSRSYEGHGFGSDKDMVAPRGGGWSSLRVVVLDLADVTAMMARSPGGGGQDSHGHRTITKISFSRDQPVGPGAGGS